MVITVLHETMSLGCFTFVSLAAAGGGGVCVCMYMCVYQMNKYIFQMGLKIN